jgi:hypothetical protein
MATQPQTEKKVLSPEDIEWMILCAQVKSGVICNKPPPKKTENAEK